MYDKELKIRTTKYIKETLKTDHVGYANMERFEGSPKGHHPQDLLPGAKTVIVFAVSIPAATTQFRNFFRDSELMPEVEIPRDDTHWYQSTVENPRMGEANTYISRYGYDWPQIMNQNIAFNLSRQLEAEGHYSLPIPGSTGGWGSDLHHTKYRKSFSLRHAAVAAGLGEMGLSGLVLVPKHGPNVRFCAVITTAEIEPSQWFEEKLCLGEKCSICINKCPSRAYEETLNYNIGEMNVTYKQVHWGTMESTKLGTSCRSISNGYCGECQFLCPADTRLKDLKKLQKEQK